ncbi:MAG: AMIN domain-containing protein, partial [Acidobacteria bacterium]
MREGRDPLPMARCWLPNAERRTPIVIRLTIACRRKPIAVGSKRMIRHALAAALVLAALAVQAEAAASASSMYASARAREELLRSAWSGAAGAGSKAPGLPDVRTVIEMYRAVVRRYPRSGYADNALYQAAGLAAEAYSRFRSEAERSVAIELLKRMVRDYPSSSLVPAARILVGDLEASPTEGRRAAAPAPHAGPAPRAGTPEPAKILAVDREALPDSVRITLRLDRPAKHTLEQLDGPPRLVFDFTGAVATAELRYATLSYGDEVVRSVRLGQRADMVTRVVLDLGEDVEPAVSTRADPYRVVIETRVKTRAAQAVDPKPAAAAQAPLAFSRRGATWAPLLPGMSSNRVGRPAGSTAEPPPPSRVEPAASHIERATARVEEDPLPSRSTPAVIERPPRGPTGTKGTGFSMARQLGLNVARIVIDPGHG